MDKERILFISHDPFSIIGSNGRTYLSLFKEYKDENIAQLFFNNLQPSTDKFSSYYRVTDIDLIKNLSTLFFNKITGNVENKPINDLKAQIVKRSVFRTEMIKLLRNFLFFIVKVININSFQDWIQDFKPKNIFFVGSNYAFAYEVLFQISKKYDIPYYIYFTDDYFIYNNGNNIISRFFHKRFVKKCKKIVEGAEELFVISHKMKQEYESYFGKKCTVLINAVDKEEICFNKSNDSDLIIFRYFGWLHSNRSSSLNYLGNCLKYLNEKYDKKCLLEVYSLTVPSIQTQKDLAVETIKLFEPLMGEKFVEAMQTSDFLVHAESFEEIDKKVTMLSISTKIPEYLLSNRCIVAVGPTKLASISVLEENNLGIVLSDKKSIENDARIINNVIENLDVYNNYCKKSIDFCKKEFDSKQMRTELKTKLSLEINH